MAAAKTGDNVTVPVPQVDRGQRAPRNILAVIRYENENDMYKLATKGGILKRVFARNQFDVCSQILLNESDLNLNSEISLRQAVQLYESNCGGQGFFKCNCGTKKRCQTNKCRCFKAQVTCNSRCHWSLTCTNKQ